MMWIRHKVWKRKKDGRQDEREDLKNGEKKKIEEKGRERKRWGMR